MEYGKIPGTDLSPSRIGLGTWAIGGSMWGGTDEERSIQTICAALDRGITLIDTAPAYGWGRSEEVVGRAIRGRRDEVILATKCGLWTDDDRGSFFTEFDGRIMRRSLRPDTIQIELERSLKRLGVECIDLHQVHWPSVPPDFTPIEDTMACLLKMRDAGKVERRAFAGDGVLGIPPIRHRPREGRALTVKQLYELASWFPEQSKRLVLLAGMVGARQRVWFELTDDLLDLLHVRILQRINEHLLFLRRAGIKLLDHLLNLRHQFAGRADDQRGRARNRAVCRPGVVGRGREGESSETRRNDRRAGRLSSAGRMGPALFLPRADHGPLRGRARWRAHGDDVRAKPARHQPQQDRRYEGGTS